MVHYLQNVFESKQKGPKSLLIIALITAVTLIYIIGAQFDLNSLTTVPSRPVPIAVNRQFFLVDDDVDQKSPNCSFVFPTLNNKTSWQELRLLKTQVYLYGAYWDNRIIDDVVVHIIALVRRNDKVKIQCHIFYDESSSIVQPYLMNVILPVPADYLTVLITCSIPKHLHNEPPPIGVSLTDDVKDSCPNLTNFLPIIYNPLPPEQTKKEDFAICHKALYYKNVDASRLLIEWIEINKILGIKKIFMYEYFPHPNMSKVLQYYTEKGFLEWKSHQIPVLPIPVSPSAFLKYIFSHQKDKWINELVPYHDCFFRNMYHYKFIFLIDLDEVIMPITNNSWPSLIKQLESDKNIQKHGPVAAYLFENNIFPDDNLSTFIAPEVPLHNHMLQHVFRLQSKTYKFNFKVLYNTDLSLGVHNHRPVFCLQRRKCNIVKVSPQVARLHHYCLKGAKECKNVDKVTPINDVTLWRFKDKFIQVTETVYKDLGIPD